MALWDGYFGVFEDQGSWVSGGDPDDIDIADFSSGEYISLNVIKVSELIDPDLAFRDLPNALTGSFGVGKRRRSLELTCWIKDNALYTAEELLDDIEEFVDDHKLTGDAAIYFVYRKYKGASWRYRRWNDSGGTKRKYLKCKVGPVRINKSRPSKIEFTIQITEAWL